MKALFLLFTLPLCANFYYFVPPKGWPPVPAKHLQGKVEVGFVAREKKTFRPSITLAVDTCKTPITAYIDATKKRHLVDRTKSWHDLGTLTTQAGPAYIGQIDYKAPWGNVRALQAFVKSEETLYLFTAVSSKSDYPDFEKAFLDTIRSFTIAPDPISTLKTDKEKKQLKEAVENIVTAWTQKNHTAEQFNSPLFQKQWKAFEKKLEKTYPNMGYHWLAMTGKITHDELLAHCAHLAKGAT